MVALISTAAGNVSKIPAVTSLAPYAGPIVGAMPLIQNAGNAHKYADKLTGPDGLQTRFNRDLEYAYELRKTDPAAAADYLRNSWNQLHADSKTFANPAANPMINKMMAPNYEKVLNQMWGTITPTYMRFMDEIAAGGTGGGNSFTTQPTATGGNPNMPSLPNIGGAFGNIIGAIMNGGRGSTGPMNERLPNGMPSNMPNIPGMPNTGGRGGGVGSTSGSLLEQLIPYILLGGGIFSDIYGARQVSGAANKAAELQNATANRAIDMHAKSNQDILDLYKSIYEQTRTDQLPGLRSGQAATRALSNLMGLPPEETGVLPTTPYGRR